RITREQSASLVDESLTIHRDDAVVDALHELLAWEGKRELERRQLFRRGSGRLPARDRFSACDPDFQGALHSVPVCRGDSSTTFRIDARQPAMQARLAARRRRDAMKPPA